MLGQAVSEAAVTPGSRIPSQTDDNAPLLLLSRPQIIMGNGYEEDVTYSNVRIALGGIACAFAIAAQLCPTPFTDYWYVLLACIIGYVVFSIVLNWHISVNEGYAIMFTLPKEVSTPRSPCCSGQRRELASPAALD